MKYLNKYVIIVAVLLIPLLSGCLKTDDFNALSDSRPTDVEITYPGLGANTPLILKTGTAASTVGNLPFEVRITSKTGKVAKTAYVDFAQVSGCVRAGSRAFTYFASKPLQSWTSRKRAAADTARLANGQKAGNNIVLYPFTPNSTTGDIAKVNAGTTAAPLMIDAHGPLGADIAINASGPESTFTYTFNPDEVSLYLLGRRGGIGKGQCPLSNPEEYRIRFVVEFTDGSVVVSQDVRFRFLKD